MILLLACASPDLLDTLQDELAREAVEAAEPGLRLFVGVAGLVAETCAVDPLNTKTLAGESAEALRATSAAFVKDDVTGDFTWEQDDVGVDDRSGTLSLAVDDARENWSFTYDRGEAEVVAGTITLDCDPTGPASIVGGNATRAAGEARDTLTLLGAAPVTGLLFSPTTARAPDQGQARWAREDEGTKLTLDDASEIDPVEGLWPGVASGKGWERDVEMRLP